MLEVRVSLEEAVGEAEVLALLLSRLCPSPPGDGGRALSQPLHAPELCFRLLKVERIRLPHEFSLESLEGEEVDDALIAQP